MKSCFRSCDIAWADVYICICVFAVSEHDLDLLVRTFTLAHVPISVCCDIDLDFVALSPSAALALVRFFLAVLWSYACVYHWIVLSGKSNHGCTSYLPSKASIQ